MTLTRMTCLAATLGVLLTLPGCSTTLEPEPAATPADAGEVPQFEWDPAWPQMPLPNGWIIGGAMGVAIDANDNIWTLHNPGNISPLEAAAAADPPRALCCTPAPSIVGFDQDGSFVDAWGGPGEGYEWSRSEHGLTIDADGNFWIGGNVAPDAQILKFSPDGTFLLQIGRSGQTGGNHDTENLGQPADVSVDTEANEVFVADGYRNHRVIVFDSETGAFKRQFGAYGNAPEDSEPVFDAAPPPVGTPPPSQFGLVHCVKIANDGLVYVCDRSNDRIQVFHKDGTYITEKIVTPEIIGAVANDLAFSHDPEQRFMYVTDHASSKVWILTRSDMEVVGSFGFAGHFGGGFTVTHNIATDSHGNLYVTEGLEGKRVQRFLYKGLGPAE